MSPAFRPRVPPCAALPLLGAKANPSSVYRVYYYNTATKYLPAVSSLLRYKYFRPRWRDGLGERRGSLCMAGRQRQGEWEPRPGRCPPAPGALRLRVAAGQAVVAPLPSPRSPEGRLSPPQPTPGLHGGSTGGTVLGTAQRGTHRHAKDRLRLGAGPDVMLSVAGAALVPRDLFPALRLSQHGQGCPAARQGWGPFSIGGRSYEGATSSSASRNCGQSPPGQCGEALGSLCPSETHGATVRAGQGARWR